MYKILVVASDFPYPPNHGGRLDIWGRIIALNNLGYQVDLVSSINDSPEVEHIDYVAQFVNRIELVQRNNNLLNLLSINPFQFQSRRGLMNLKDINGGYDFIILESEYMFSLLSNEDIIYGSNIILRVHNDEEVYLKSLSKSSRNIAKKMYYWIEFWKFRVLNRKVLNTIENYMFISKDEHKKFELNNENHNSIFLPTSFDLTGIKRSSTNSKNVLFIGSLFMVNNKEAIKWYVEKVHPLLDVKDYKLLIAGNSRGESIEWLKKITNHYENIEIYDSPKELDFLYKQSAVFINPMLNGAGVKLKTIEAIKNGLPVVSTSIGVEGTGLIDKETVLISNHPATFANSIKRLINDSDTRNNLAFSAQEFLKNNYNQEQLLKSFFESLKN